MKTCGNCAYAFTPDGRGVPAGHLLCGPAAAKADPARNAPAWPWVEPHHTCGQFLEAGPSSPVRRKAAAAERAKAKPAAKRKARR